MAVPNHTNKPKPPGRRSSDFGLERIVKTSTRLNKAQARLHDIELDGVCGTGTVRNGKMCWELESMKLNLVGCSVGGHPALDHKSVVVWDSFTSDKLFKELLNFIQEPEGTLTSVYALLKPLNTQIMSADLVTLDYSTLQGCTLKSSSPDWTIWLKPEECCVELWAWLVGTSSDKQIILSHPA
jgi:hypothetical protein